MGMNTGMLFGTVECPWGPVKNAQVDISSLRGDSGSLINIQGNEDNENSPTFVQTDSDGKYVLFFYWYGTEIAKVIGSRLWIKSFAVGNRDPERSRTRAFLCLNLKALFSQLYPTFDAPIPETFDVAKDFILAYRGVAPFAPQHKIFLSTEVWGILGRANFFIAHSK